jgi:hypothetical protein
MRLDIIDDVLGYLHCDFRHLILAIDIHPILRDSWGMVKGIPYL